MNTVALYWLGSAAACALAIATRLYVTRGGKSTPAITSLTPAQLGALISDDRAGIAAALYGGASLWLSEPALAEVASSGGGGG